MGDKTNAQNHVLQDKNGEKKIQERIDSWLGQNRRSKLCTHGLYIQNNIFIVLKKFPACTSTVGDKTNAQNHVLQNKNVEKNPGKFDSCSCYKTNP